MADFLFLDSDDEERRDERIDQKPEEILDSLQDRIKELQELRKDLIMQNTSRDKQLESLNQQIEDTQMEIMFKNLGIEKNQNILNELDRQRVNDREDEEEEKEGDDLEEHEEGEKINNQIKDELVKYINRIVYVKTREQESKIERKKSSASVVVVKFYRNDPTDEEKGEENSKIYSYEAFGLSQSMDFQSLKQLCVDHFEIQNPDDYCLTDKEHHDLALLKDEKVMEFVEQDQLTLPIFLLRKKNRTMKELLASQKDKILSKKETENHEKLKGDYIQIFKLMIKEKPGLDTYDGSIQSDAEFLKNDPIDGSFFNFILMFTVMVLMILSLYTVSIQPHQERILYKYDNTVEPLSFYEYKNDMIYGDTSNDVPGLPDFFYDIDENGKSVSFDFVPIQKRLVAVQQIADLKSSYGDLEFTSFDQGIEGDSDLDKTDLDTPKKGAWSEYQTVPGSEKINIDGEFGSYSGDGFIYDFPVGKTRAEILELMNTNLGNEDKEGYFGRSIRAYIAHNTYFEMNRALVLDVTLLFEITKTQSVIVTERHLFFQYDKDRNDVDTQHRDIDIALGVISIFGYLVNVFFHARRMKGQKRDWKSLYSFSSLVKYLVIALFIAYLALYYSRPDEDLKDFLTNSDFKIIHNYGEQRITATHLLACCLFLHSMVMIKSFVFSSTISVFINIFSMSYKDFMAYIIIFFASLIGVSFMWYYMFGIYNQNFSSYFGTVFEIFQYHALGKIYLVYQDLTAYSFTLAAFLILFTFFVLFIILDAVLMALVQENVRYLMIIMAAQTDNSLPFKENLMKLYNRFLGYKDRILAKCQKGKGKKKK